MYRISLLLACLAALLSADFSAWATVKSWNNASGGTWFSSGSWTPSGVPGSADSVSITLSGTYTVTIDSHKVNIRQLILGGSSGIQTLRIVAPADSLVLTGTSIVMTSNTINVNGRLDVGQKVLFVRDWQQGTSTLANSGTILVDSVGIIGLGSYCLLMNQPGGNILLNGSADILGNYNGQCFDSHVENSGSMVKSGGDTLTLYCVYDQLSGGTLALQGGMLRAWDFTTDGLVTLASGTATMLGGGEVIWPYFSILSSGVVELQGTASISGDTYLRNNGELRHILAGTSVIAAPYQAAESGNPGDLRVLAGKLSLTAENNGIDGLVVISPLAELEVSNGFFSYISSVTSAVADSGSLTLAGSNFTSVEDGSFPFSGALQIRGDTVTFDPVTDPVSIHSFTIDSGAYFYSTVTIQTDSVSMNGGTTDADVEVSGHYGWTAGDFVGSGGSTITIAPGTTLDVHGPTAKQLNTRDLVIGGTASMSGSGQFSMSGGASIVVDPSGDLTIGDSISITGPGDSLINHGQLTFDCPNDTATIGAFLSNLPTGRTTGTIDILSGQVVCAAADNMGTVNMHPGSELRVEGQWNNNGLLVMSNGSRCVVSGILENKSSGVLHMNGGAEIEGSGLVNNAGLVDRVSGALRSPTHSIVATVFNNLDGTGCLEVISDTLTLSSGGSNAGDIYIHSGAVLRILGSFVNQAAGTIRGGGTLEISGATFTNSGALAPGSSPGTLRIVGALSTQGTIHIEVAGRLPGSEYDRLLIGGNADLGGTLHLSRLNGFIPTLTDTFRCITFAARSGEFAAVTGTPVGNGTYLEIAYRPTEIVQYVCAGVSDIQLSAASILDSVHRELTDTVTLQVCNEGHCPLWWSSDYEQHSPAGPSWLTIIEGNDGLLERTLCKTMKLVISAAGLSPGTYSGDVVVTSNDPDEPVTEIPVQLVVPNDRVRDLVIRLNLATSSITLSWSAVFGANSYKVYRSNPGSYNPTVFMASTADTTYTHEGTLGGGGATRLVYHVVASTDAP